MYGVQAGHNPVLVALHMGIAKFTVDGETREVLVGEGIAEVTPTFVLLLVDSAEQMCVRDRPNHALDGKLPDSFSVPGTHYFPTGFFDARYVVTADPFPLSLAPDTELGLSLIHI